jgi:hypothetical protein
MELRRIIGSIESHVHVVDGCCLTLALTTPRCSGRAKDGAPSDDG